MWLKLNTIARIITSKGGFIIMSFSMIMKTVDDEVGENEKEEKKSPLFN